MNKIRIDKKTSYIALMGILGAQALALSFFENLIPAIPGLPPGAKPGFSNIITMFTANTIGFWGAIIITIIKSIFASVTRGLTAGLMSLSGGLLSTIIMVALVNMKKRPFGLMGVSILSAIAHNLGQLIVACIISGTAALAVSYGPLLLLFAIITGSITGTILRIVMPALNKQLTQFTKG
ncbi:MAG: Gx transporter family protein [Ruminococcaceae bacterium]|nr:Gx transporter family protein [Oscillospiraceae bacterium]